MKIINWEQDFLCTTGNVHAPSETNSDDSKDSFYEELEQVFDRFPKYHV